MATYLQGVQDYIPQFQPFQPDLNLYSNVLQTKQTEYDSAWKSLNNVYGQYFYADLTRDGNIARKEEVLKNIDFNLKKITGLDLSLDQNVAKAAQVFKPFYEDEHIMKDMAWTKNYNNQKTRAEGLKNSLDEKAREQYWDGGVRAMDYMRQEFKDAADPEALSFQNTSYTPYINAVKKAQEVAKEAGLSMETPEFSKDGRWVIKKKNGEQLMEPLSKLFEAELGNDPAIQAVYKTQAYLDRKDYAESNAAQFNGDKNAAEMKYLEENYNNLKAANERRYKGLKNASSSYDTKIKDIEQQIKNKTADPDAEAYLENLKEAKEMNDKIITRIDADNEALKEQSGTPSTTSGFVNPYGDVKSLRWKVDNAMASSLMQKDLNEAAQIFAYKDAKVDIEANIYAVNEQKHAFSMQEVAARNQGLKDAARITAQSKLDAAAAEYLYEAGTHEPDLRKTVVDEKGNTVANPNYMQPVEKPEYNEIHTRENPQTTDQYNVKMGVNREAKNRTEEVAKPFLMSMAGNIKSLNKDGVFSDEDVKFIFNDPTMTADKFNNLVSQNGYWYIKNGMGTNKTKNIARRYEWALKKYAKDSRVSPILENNRATSNQFNDYLDYVDNVEDWQKKSSKIVEQELATKGGEIGQYAKYLYDAKGNLRSEAEFNDLVYGKGGNAQAQKNKKEDLRAAQMYAMIPDLPTIIDYATGNYREGLMNQAEQGLKSIRETRDSGVYKDLVKEAGKIYTSGKVLDGAPGTPGTGAGKFTQNENFIMVSPKSPMTSMSKRFYMEFNRDFNNIDFDESNSVITFGGATKSAFLKSKDSEADEVTGLTQTKKGKALMRLIDTEINNTKSKFKNFELSSIPIAAGMASKGGMTIRPDAEWLKQYIITDKNPTGIITQTEYNQAIVNGITVITDNQNFTNGLFKSSQVSALKANIDYSVNNGQPYVFTSPFDENNKWTISKNNYGTGEYVSTVQYRAWDPNTKSYSTVSYTDPISPGNNIDNLRDEYQLIFNNIYQNNKILSNGR
jgi:hypothetical protein